MGDSQHRAQQPRGNLGDSQGSGANNTRFSSPALQESNDLVGAQAGAASVASAQASQSPHHQQHGQLPRPDPFAMASLHTALPDASFQNYNLPHGQRFQGTASGSPMIYPAGSVSHYVGQPAVNLSGSAPYNIQYQAQYTNVYPPPYAQPHHAQTLQQILGGNSGNAQIFPTQGFLAQQPLQQPPTSPYFVQPNQYIQSQIYSGSPSSASYGSRMGYLGSPAQPQRNTEYLGAAMSGGGLVQPSSTVASGSQSTVVRGPPRKPRQSGHAIWIGNLPPQTELMSLVYHVCKETTGLESLFLISKSNCAFANYKDEAACAAAQSRIHDSRFQTVRLVSRLRRTLAGAVPGESVSAGPAALTQPSAGRSSSPDDESVKTAGVEDSRARDSSEDSSLPKDKYFIVKSLTVEDLELSVRNGSWATQSHNEEALNKAYQTADNVYLIFSANKSGEYFGYAKMTSPINDDPAAAIEFAPKAQAVEDPELPKAIPTAATEHAPKGRIIDDSARGTIFWEAEREETEDIDEEEDIRSNKSEIEAEPAKAWGKPFQVEWISTTRLPFYRTRGLRNRWNSNREVKIARDGTELEPAVGRRLLGLFHKLPSPSTQSFPTQTMPSQIGPMGGIPHTRQYP